MPTTLDFKGFEHMPRWRPEASLQANTGAGNTFAWDHRNDATKHPNAYYLRSASALDTTNPVKGYGDYIPLATPGLTGTFGAGATCVFHPSQGPRGTIAAGATTTTITLTTALPTAVGVNQLANRGDTVGFRIRICTNTAGASGTTEERTIIANTAGTTPTITLDTPLSQAPASGAIYEILAGRVYLLSAGTTAAGCWKHYDVATNSYSGNLSITNLPATISSDSSLVALSESHVSFDRVPGSGFISGGATVDGKNAIQGTAATSTTITGSGMPATLQTNEYRNFQVRIVADSVTPTSVGQRRRIASHTSGAAGVFTVSTAFTVTPSSSAIFVVENDDDKILLTSSGGLSIYNYNITANTWDTTTWAAALGNGPGVVMEQSFGIARDASGNARHSFIYRVRGNATSSIDVLDIAGAATGSWSNDITYGNRSQTFTTGTCGAYDAVTNEGKWLHLNVNGTARMVRFDMRNRVIDNGLFVANLQGAAVVGGKLFVSTFIDGSTKVSRLYQALQTSSQVVSIVLPTS
jgi:hypothetical protein